jgi:signal transduction histidine kinase
MEVKRQPVALRSLLDLCLETVRPLVQTDAIELIGGLESAPPVLVSDEEKLKQIIINLLSNAAKFTGKGSILLGARERHGVVEISVRDTGIGIPADKLEAIFEEFHQVDGVTAAAHSGTGLGLSISRRLARLLGGDIEVASEVGQGSTFTLTLPLRQDATAGLKTAAPTIASVPPRPGASRPALASDEDLNGVRQRAP